jgi:hypothetical protein
MISWTEEILTICARSLVLKQVADLLAGTQKGGDYRRHKPATVQIQAHPQRMLTHQPGTYLDRARPDTP